MATYDKENETTAAVYFKTPHHGKEATSLMEFAAGSNTNETKVFDSVDDSKPAAKKAKTNGEDGITEMDMEPTDDVSEEEWNAICAKIVNEAHPDHQGRLEVFLNALNKHNDAKKTVNDLQQTVSNTLGEQRIENILKSIVPVHDYLTEGMNRMQSNLYELFGHNHEQRLAIANKLEASRVSFDRMLDQFVARLKKQDPIATDEEATADDADADKVGGASDDKIPEPDWDAIKEFNPSSSEAVDSTLAAFKKWEVATNNFERALDEIHLQLTKPHAKMLEDIAYVYQATMAKGDDEIAAIQQAIINNCKRRHELEEALQKAKDCYNNSITHFMSEVGGKSSKIGKKLLKKGVKPIKKFMGFGKKTKKEEGGKKKKEE